LGRRTRLSTGFAEEFASSIVVFRKERTSAVSSRLYATQKAFAKSYNHSLNKRIQKRRGESYELGLLRNCHAYQTNGESVSVLATKRSRTPLQIGNTELGDNSPGLNMPLRLSEYFKNQDSMKSRVDPLINTGTRPDFLIIINQLKEARITNTQSESVKIVKDKANSGFKGPIQRKCKHCEKNGHESEAHWKWLVTNEGRACVEKEANDKANKGSDIKSKTPERVSEAIEFESDYSDRSVAWNSTANSKRDDKWCLDTTNHMTWSWDSRSGRVYHTVEPYEEDKIMWNVGIISCEMELASSPYCQVQRRHLTVEESIPEASIGVEEESLDLRSYVHVGNFNLCSRFDPNHHRTAWSNFIQASFDALLPNEASPNPKLKPVSPTFSSTQLLDLSGLPVPWSPLRGRSISMCGNV
jgi:hypothetical protein